MDQNTENPVSTVDASTTAAALRLFENSPDSLAAFRELVKVQPGVLETSTGQAFLEMLGKQ